MTWEVKGVTFKVLLGSLLIVTVIKSIFSMEQVLEPIRCALDPINDISIDERAALLNVFLAHDQRRDKVQPLPKPLLTLTKWVTW